MSLFVASQSFAAPRHQTGATLLVAIMMLLIITLLALSSLRGVSLESRITGNLKQQKTLFNAAEGALRIGESSISLTKAPSLDNACNAASCLRWKLSDLTATTGKDTVTRFGTADNGTNTMKLTTNYDVKVQWYVVDLGNLVGSSQGNCAVMGCGPHHYEINACASATSYCTESTDAQRVILRTVIARYY
ncbi:PilX N-terminal domain-containing pilus assembly protein [Pseudomonas sp. LP_7_YM]|uniref:pilus assembly PilX family protein n=1 Tax=Pseudomonas sp. LP_7_YM TaxID=2485137 RepID=UPI00105F207D|nr:PilX N-terminal domain-containing pilus assembly protein [Pseudomonas sp. LP_7_YM]TDV65787.1 type IV pilus assembly protein PilX [Pseudomonas sp. LP_7_YM]